jgi:23S rRNA (pseudouridine1915-N3)-methyltransferase
MTIEILCVGKLKEKYLVQAMAHYTKQLSKIGNVKCTELPDEKTPDNASVKEEMLIKQKEGEKLLAHIKDEAYVVALDLGGKMLSTDKLRSLLKNQTDLGKTHFTFVIGGSLGLSEAVLKRADYQLCFSKMTFPHQLFRVMLAEQLNKSYLK